jgi:hypothetical protein
MEKKMEPMEIDEIYPGLEAELGLADYTAPLTEEIMPGVRPLWYGDFAKQDIPPPSWIVEKFIPDESITIISALPGQFKTWLAFDIAIQVALGKPLFDQFETKQTKVLIIDEESGPGRLRKRLQMLGATDDTPIAVASYTGFKLTEESANWLIAYCKAQDIGLIVFDSLTRLHNADENTAKEMSVVMGDFKRLAQAGLAVLLIHHNRKPGPNRNDGGNAMRGSVEILAACDAQISMKRDGNSRTVKVTQNKNRDAEDVATFSLELTGDEDRCWFEYRGNMPKIKLKRELAEELITEVLTDNERLFQSEIIAKLGDSVGEKLAVQALGAMVERQILITSKGDKNKTYYQLAGEKSDE